MCHRANDCQQLSTDELRRHAHRYSALKPVFAVVLAILLLLPVLLAIGLVHLRRRQLLQSPKVCVTRARARTHC